MTANQINYAKHLEDVRTHRTNEEIAARNAVSAERQASAAEVGLGISQSNAEANLANAYANTISANAAAQNALVNAQAQQETARHNIASEHNEALKISTGYGQTLLTTEAQKYSADASKYVADVKAKSDTKITRMQNRNKTVNTILDNLTSARNTSVSAIAGTIQSLLRVGKAS